MEGSKICWGSEETERIIGEVRRDPPRRATQDFGFAVFETQILGGCCSHAEYYTTVHRLAMGE
jgi:hypothetical protein